MKKVLVFLFAFLVCHQLIAQVKITHLHQRAVAVFDSVMVAQTGFDCLQYKNKLLSDAYKYNNYHGGPIFMGSVVTEKVPAVTVNGEFLMHMTPENIFKYKRLISFKYYPKGKSPLAAGVTDLGLLAFIAE
ncbi:hypothetical protein [Pedobacter gandavensis]|uniref:GLPGLI family protein n=1 Tax=Pedobacter gandavensis TaxID=2679963 RepID=A0ABR6ETP1_9SPHI|nr:hypothetical protein [Pedobacter gandavensis]MBB2148630.1 hypothetical protein [Pedobacter gandavensis]